MDDRTANKFNDIIELADSLAGFESIQKIGPAAIRLMGSYIASLARELRASYPSAQEKHPVDQADR